MKNESEVLTMARYQHVLPVVASKEYALPKIHQLMTKKGYRYEPDGEIPVYRKGDGFWVLGRFLKITYAGNFVSVEAWVTNMGSEMDLEGFVGSAGKKPLKKLVEQVEAILAEPEAGFDPSRLPAYEAPRPVQQEPLPAGITKKEYYKNYAGAEFKRQLKGAAILAYVCAGINAVVGFLYPTSFVDALILLGLALGMHLGKSKGCAIGLLVYSIISMVLGIVLNGTVSGWWILLAGIYSMIIFNKADKRYKELTQ